MHGGGRAKIQMDTAVKAAGIFSIYRKVLGVRRCINSQIPRAQSPSEKELSVPCKHCVWLVAYARIKETKERKFLI